MINKLVIVGPFPEPVYGMSLANKYLVGIFSNSISVRVRHFNTNFDDRLKAKGRQGKFEIGFALRSLVNLVANVWFLILNAGSVAYFTPPQSWLGFIRFCPSIVVSYLINKRTVLHIHGSRLADNINNAPFFFKYLCRLILRKASAVIALSPSIAKRFEYNLKLSNLIVCMNGIPLPIVDNVDSDRSNLASPLRCLFLGNLMKDKGVLELFDAVVMINSNFIKVRVDFAGEIEAALEGVVFSFLKNYPEYFTYHGVVSGKEKEDLFRSCALFCLPSYDEGVPLAILEAYSYGCAVITTDVGGIPDVFDEPGNGFMCSARDVQSLVSAINRAISDLERLKQVCFNNSIEAKLKYSLESFGMQVGGALFLDIN